MKSAQVKTIREFKGMTQPQFAKWLGVASSTIAQVESGHREVSEALASRIALKFDVTDRSFLDFKKRKQQTHAYFFNRSS